MFDVSWSVSKTFDAQTRVEITLQILPWQKTRGEWHFFTLSMLRIVDCQFLIGRTCWLFWWPRRPRMNFREQVIAVWLLRSTAPQSPRQHRTISTKKNAHIQPYFQEFASTKVSLQNMFIPNEMCFTRAKNQSVRTTFAIFVEKATHSKRGQSIIYKMNTVRMIVHILHDLFLLEWEICKSNNKRMIFFCSAVGLDRKWDRRLIRQLGCGGNFDVVGSARSSQVKHV